MKAIETYSSHVSCTRNAEEGEHDGEGEHDDGWVTNGG